jgi:hypothetical protein
MHSNFIFTAQVLAHISLVNYHYLSGVQVAALLGGFHAHAEAKRDISDAEHDNTNVGGSVLRNSGEVTLKDVVSIKVGLFTIGLHPHLVLAVFCEVVETSHIQLEFICL